MLLVVLDGSTVRLSTFIGRGATLLDDTLARLCASCFCFLELLNERREVLSGHLRAAGEMREPLCHERGIDLAQRPLQDAVDERTRRCLRGHRCGRERPPGPLPRGGRLVEAGTFSPPTTSTL